LVVGSDPNGADFRPPQLSVEEALRPRFRDRMDLLRQFDSMRRELDGAQTRTMDRYQQEAARVLTSDAARKAFAIDQEPGRGRDPYGRQEVGQRCLLAGRLIEAGARIVTVDFPCVPGQKAFSWDDHASVWNIFEQMKIRLPVLDQVTSA